MRAHRMSKGIFSALLVLGCCSVLEGKPKKQDQQPARDAYIQRIQSQSSAQPEKPTLGSLWTPNGALVQMATDYKARRLNDTIIINVVHQTTAQTTQDVTTGRDFSTQSAITGLAGALSTTGVNPLLTANSSTKLAGTGQADSGSSMSTSLAGQVISVLPNGNMVVEAQRRIAVNNQTETVLVRGVLRPGDVAPDNSALSTSLMNLEIELKGKGVVSDSSRPPNIIMRAILHLIGF